jgi:peptidoglycan hydrolase-like protein with peptidoglycan-binding domain
LTPTLAVLVVAAACGDDSGGSGQGAVAAAEARLSNAQADLTETQGALTAANEKFCDEAADYVSALDRYGKLLTDEAVTVGDIKTGGADLVAPRDSVTSAATAVKQTQSDVSAAEQELADAQAALANAQASAASAPATATAAPTSSTTTLVPPATIDRVKQAESDFTQASAGITDTTPVVQASVEFSSAAFALEIAWLQVLNDAGCLADDQQAAAVTQVSDYTVALQTQLQAADYYQGAIDGIYGPQTVEAVKQFQAASGLPATGLVDPATALALEKQAAAEAKTQTTVLQTILKLTGFWDGPIDGTTTPELTDALKAFQTELGVEPTGVVDPPTLAAFLEALATVQSAVTGTTTTSVASETTAAGSTAPPLTTAPAPPSTT